MRRREFLGVAGAGVLGALWRPRGVADVATDSAWTKSIYGTDLRWGLDPAFSSTVTVGNASPAFLLWRRINGIFYYVLRVTIGTTTTFSSSGQWFFEFPNLFSNTSDTQTVLPDFVGGGAGSVTVAAATDVSSSVTAYLYRPGYVLLGVTTTAPVAVLYALSYDTGSGAITKVFPATWAAGDYLNVSGWAACLDN